MVELEQVAVGMLNGNKKIIKFVKIIKSAQLFFFICLFEFEYEIDNHLFNCVVLFECHSIN